jgi:hypothetical protein
MALLDEVTHPAVLSGLGAVVGYGVILAVLTIVVFGIPYLAFWYF